MTMQITTKPNLAPEDGISALIRRPEYSDRFKEVLRERAPQFMSSVIQVGRSLGKDCDAKSIIASAMTAAALDLPIDRNLGFAWIVPYKQNGVKYGQFQMGWKGFVQLAQRSGQYKNISSPRAINAEAFKGYDSIGVPMIDWNLVDESKDPVGYAFGWRLVNGGESIFFWSIAKIKAHAQRYSQAYRGGHDTPWKTHFPEMCQKTLVKNSLSQFGILSIQMQNALQMDSAVLKDIGAEPEYLDNTIEVQATEPKNKPRLGRPPKSAEPLQTIAETVAASEPAEQVATDQEPPQADDGDLGPQPGYQFDITPALSAKLVELKVSRDSLDKWILASSRSEGFGGDFEKASAKLLSEDRSLKLLQKFHVMNAPE